MSSAPPAQVQSKHCAPRLSSFLLLLHALTGHADCVPQVEQATNRDGSVVRIEQRQCDNDFVRSILVHSKPAGAAQYATILRRTQDAVLAPTGGANWRDVDGDGIFEYEEIGACGAGPNCEAVVYRLSDSRKSLHLLFDGAYASLTTVAGFLVTSGRASCCAWEHAVYRRPPAPLPVQESDRIYRITVGDLSVGDDDSGANRTACRVYQRELGEWKSVVPPERGLLKLCEVYGEDYELNPRHAR